MQMSSRMLGVSRRGRESYQAAVAHLECWLHPGVHLLVISAHSPPAGLSHTQCGEGKDTVRGCQTRWFISFMRCYRKLLQQSYLLSDLLKYKKNISVFKYYSN